MLHLDGGPFLFLDALEPARSSSGTKTEAICEVLREVVSGLERWREGGEKPPPRASSLLRRCSDAVLALLSRCSSAAPLTQH